MKNNIIEEFDKEYDWLKNMPAGSEFEEDQWYSLRDWIKKALDDQKKELIDSWAEYTEEALRKQLKKINKL